MKYKVERELTIMSSEQEMIPKMMATAQATESVNQRGKSDGLSFQKSTRMKKEK